MVTWTRSVARGFHAYSRACFFATARSALRLRTTHLVISSEHTINSENFFRLIHIDRVTSRACELRSRNPETRVITATIAVMAIAVESGEVGEEGNGTFEEFPKNSPGHTTPRSTDDAAVRP